MRGDGRIILLKRLIAIGIFGTKLLWFTSTNFYISVFNALRFATGFRHGFLLL